jgi:hypothetical protein
MENFLECAIVEQTHCAPTLLAISPAPAILVLKISQHGMAVLILMNAPTEQAIAMQLQLTVGILLVALSAPASKVLLEILKLAVQISMNAQILALMTV